MAILPECNADTAQQIMHDIRERFATLRFNHEGIEFGCTISAGVVCNTQYPDASSGLRPVKADEALYKAKLSGRNLVFMAA